jgi:hypothetical protein
MEATMTTIRTARKTLNRAFAELSQAQGDAEKIRQAAEKGWRAAREAVYALIHSDGREQWPGTMSVQRVGAFEADELGRPLDSGQPLTDAYSRAMSTLHAECFYNGEIPEDVKYELQRVHDLIDQAEADMALLPVRRRYRK